MLVWVKNLVTSKKYAIESSCIFRWDGKDRLPFETDTFVPSNNFCTMEDGQRVLHAAYAFAETRSALKEKLDKKAGASDMVLRAAVVPTRKSITPLVAPAASQIYKEQVATASGAQAKVEEAKLLNMADVNANILSKARESNTSISNSSDRHRTISKTTAAGNKNKAKVDTAGGTKSSKSKKKSSRGKRSRISSSEEEEGDKKTDDKKKKPKIKNKEESGDDSDDQAAKLVISSPITIEEPALLHDASPSPPVGGGSKRQSLRDSLKTQPDVEEKIEESNDAIPSVSNIKKAAVSQKELCGEVNPGEVKFFGLSPENSIADNIILLGHNLSLVFSSIQDLTKNFESFKKDVHGNLSTLNKDLQKLTKSVSDIKSKTPSSLSLCKLATLERAVAGHDDVTVPEGKVLISVNDDGNRFLDKVEIITKVEKGKLTGLSGRCLSLAQLFWPRDWSRYSLSGEIVEDKIITQEDTEAFAVILRSLKWTAPVDLEEAKVRRALGKALSSFRDKEAKEAKEAKDGKGGGSGTRGGGAPKPLKDIKNKSVKPVASISGSSGTEGDGDANPRTNTKMSVNPVATISGSSGTEGDGDANPHKNTQKSGNLVVSTSSSFEAEEVEHDNIGGNDEVLCDTEVPLFDPLNDSALNEDALLELDDDHND